MKLKEALKETYNPEHPFMVVNYFGVNVLIEPKYNFIATDGSGTVLLFIKRPGFTATTWASEGPEKVLMYLNKKIDGWKDSLAEVSMPPKKTIDKSKKDK